MKSYDHKRIERKWREAWDASRAYATDTDTSKPPYYVLDMFPYPSGAGLHVGHPKGYIASDVIARKKRMEGKRVLHPMGWDAFGLPAENYAIKTGTPPQKTTDQSIATFKKQISNLALSYDWDREIGSHRPDYYRWTQWLFTRFFEKGLVYKKKALVNWDPIDQTVLANEQVLPDGTAERSGAVVEKKELEQWFYKITDYADELIDKLDTLDWPESTKTNQRNWIGRSEGAEIDFLLDFDDEAINTRTGPDGKRAQITVFTTRPDTLFGATYLVLAPEHQWVRLALEHKTVLSNNDEVQAYVDKARKKSDIERQTEQKEKTGVRLGGVEAINPATGEKIPLFVADYVLGGYGTGAIMAVPAHDERDYAFARKFDLPIRQVIEPVFIGQRDDDRPREGEAFFDRPAITAILKHWSEDKYMVLDWKQVAWHTFVTGGIEEGQTAEEAARREIIEETGFKNLRLVQELPIYHSKFFHTPKKRNQFAHFRSFVFELTDDEQDALTEEESAKHDMRWVSRDEMEKNLVPRGQLWLWKQAMEGGAHAGEGILGNSGAYTGLASEEARKIIAEKFGRAKKTYKLRDWLISRQRYWGAPIPIVYDPEGKPHAIPEEHLPWLLPTDVEYMPKGTSPLGSSKELLERTERIFGKGWKPEIDTMDTFACSSWYFFRFADPHNDKEFASKAALDEWLPVDLYIGGAEHTVLHLLYARFYTKALRDMGYLDFDEPFLKLRHQGLIVAEDGRKMSKRYGNVINPDDIVELYGADTLRLYEMFMGPFQDSIAWSTQSMIGARRFLERFWRAQEYVTESGNLDDAKYKAVDRALHQAIKKIGADIDGFKFNTAVSQLMILLKIVEESEQISREQWESFLKLLAPFAPHMTEELWAEAGKGDSIHHSTWPTYSDEMAREEKATIAIQINGKTRATVEVESDASDALLESKAREAVAERLVSSTVNRVVVVKGRLVNFVVTES